MIVKEHKTKQKKHHHGEDKTPLDTHSVVTNTVYIKLKKQTNTKRHQNIMRGEYPEQMKKLEKEKQKKEEEDKETGLAHFVEGEEVRSSNEYIGVQIHTCNRIDVMCFCA